MAASNECNGISKQGAHTKCLHGPGHSKHIEHAHTFPIFQTSTFVFDSADHGAQLFDKKVPGHIYTRIGNPTVEKFEEVMATLEEGAAGIAFGSGLAAINGALLPFLKAGDHIVCGDTMYGPSLHVVSNVFGRYGINCTFVDSSSVQNVAAAIKPNSKLIYLETPANPTLKISDLIGICELAKKHGLLVAVDNTFSSPIFQQPLNLGCDIVLHSLTKYVNGHGDVVGGVVVAKNKEQGDLIRKYRTDTGGILAPMDAFLVRRGIQTLAMRMERHHTNGLVLANFLKSHPKISKVLHPGMPDFPGYELGRKQMKGYGGTFSFLMKGGFDAAKKLIENCHLCSLAVSLGCCDTLIEHPASMTHASVPEELMKQQGLSKDLVRISVGLEDPEDIIADLKQALEKC